MAFVSQRPKLLLHLAVLILLLGLAFLPATAQQITGSIAGTVKDAQGALINTATVSATNTDTGLSRSTPVGNDGSYLIQYLPLGNYTVEVDAANFKKFVQKNIIVTLDQTQLLSVALEVGGANQTVTVTDAPPQVNTADAELGSTISQDDVIGLPLVNRNAYAELALVPGVMQNSASQSSNPSGTPNMVMGNPSVSVQINGSVDAGSAQVNFYLDGGYNITDQRGYGNPLPTPDALEEFRVETSDFSAQYGHMSAGVITAVTKSGTNKFHGSLFEFNRNTDLNAYAWNSVAKQPYHRNQYGGTVGGPVKHDKAFFFFSYAALKEVVGTAENNVTVLSDLERLGDFTQDAAVLGKTIYQPGTKTQWSGTNSSSNCQTLTANCIPTASLDPTTQAILKLTTVSHSTGTIPRANITASNGIKNLWSGNYTAPLDDHEYLGKYDEDFAKDHVAATYFYLFTVQDALGGGNFLWDTDESSSTQQNVVLSDVHTFSPNFANQTWLTITSNKGARVQYPQTSLTDLGTTTFNIQGPKALPQINVQSGPTFGVGLAGPVAAADFYELRDMVTMNKGKHSLYYGGEFALTKAMLWANLYNYGIFGFTNSAPTTTSFGVSDFLAGQVATMEQDTPYQTLMSGWRTSLFLQDNYRVAPRLTLNLGLRWDIDSAPVESRNHTDTFIPGRQSTVVPSAPAGILFPGDSGVGRGIVSTRYHHIAPRIGLAWDPFGDGKTAVRAGAGMFYGSVSGDEWNLAGTALPWCVRQSFNSIASFSNVYGNPASFPKGNNTFPVTTNAQTPDWFAPSAIQAVNINAQWPLIYQINAAVQRQLPQQVTLTAAYVGALSRDVPTFIDGNFPVWAAGASDSQASVNARRPYFGAAGANNLGLLTYQVTNQTGAYHSLQVSANRPMTKNLMMSGFFVWSNARQSSSEVANGLMTAQDFAQLWEERGYMDADMREVAVVDAVWQIDYFRGSNLIAKNVLNGWTISPIYSVHSGMPFTVTTGGDNNMSGSEGSNRPNLVPGVNAFFNAHRPRSVERNAWFNTAAFTANCVTGATGCTTTGLGPGGVDGNEPRDYLRAPGYRDVDLGLFRDFKFERGITFQIRGEADNAFNLVSLSAPTGTMTSGNYGKITGASSPRIIQVGGRLTF